MPATDSVSTASTDPLGDEIATLCAHINAATYRLLCLLKTYDEEGRWEGFRTCAHWLSWRTGISLGPAREKVRVARCLPNLPRISGALAKGKLSYSKARALTRIASPENEKELLSFADHGTTAHVEKLVRDARRVDRSKNAQAERAERRGLYLYPAEDGNYEIRGRLSPEVGSLLLKALEAAERKLYHQQREAGTEHETTAEQRRADALGLWLDEQVQPEVQLVVHSFEGAEQSGLAGGVPAALAAGAAAGLVTEEGGRVSPETSLRLASDAEVVPIKRASDGSVLDVGRRLRTVDWRLRKALEARDGGCRFPGCGSRLRTHAHHIIPWAEGGETAMNNLVLLCPLHHRAVHEGGWQAEVDAGGVLRFLNPLGVEMPLAPKAPDIGGLLPERDGAPPQPRDLGLARWHARKDIEVWAGSTVWHGERIEWDWALDWFCKQPGEGEGRREGGDAGRDRAARAEAR
ncbi:MAG: DUF222 domain-containing protein [Gemmatimonadota bacterium]|nr:DUF222 domain-containing protein [Gemmatimonadota bacterium]